MRYRVILVPFPFDDLTGSKVRPAVSLTDAVGAHRHVVLAFITSVVPPTLEPTDLLLDPGSADFTRTGLKVRSALRMHRLVTVSATVIQRQLGVLTPNLQAQVQQSILHSGRTRAKRWSCSSYNEMKRSMELMGLFSSPRNTPCSSPSLPDCLESRTVS